MCMSNTGRHSLGGGDRDRATFPGGGGGARKKAQRSNVKGFTKSYIFNHKNCFQFFLFQNLTFMIPNRGVLVRVQDNF